MKRPPRTLRDIRNDIVRAKGNLAALQNSPLTEDDRVLLEPRYKAHLEHLQDEEKAFRCEVHDPEILSQ